MSPRPNDIRPDWWVKTLAGALLGFSLAILASGLLSRYMPIQPPQAGAQLAMWLVPAVWLAVLSGCFFFRSGLRAWAWLGGANLLALGLLHWP